MKLKDNYSLQEVLKINRMIDGAIALANVRGKAAICQGGYCCEVGCRTCPFYSFCDIEYGLADLYIFKNRFNSFIEDKYFQIRNGI